MESDAALLDTTARCLARYETQFAGGPLLAAISGGRDSTLLLWILAELRATGRLPAPVIVAHVDHAAHASSRDAAIAVQQLADDFGFPFVSERLSDIAPTEAAWRDARYAALVRMAQAADSRVVLTAHHADDDLETVLFRILRGTGPRGLAGIPEFRRLTDDVSVVRPLLRCRAAVLHECLDNVGRTFVEDPTNHDLSYSRNRLRHELIPALRASVGDDMETTLLALSEAARRVTDILETRADLLLAEHAEFPTEWRCELTIPSGDADAPLPRNFLEEAVCQIHVRLHRRRQRPRWNFVVRVLDLLTRATGQRVHGRHGLLVERTRSGLLFVDTACAGAVPDTALELPIDGTARFGATEWLVRSTPCPEPPLSPSPEFPVPVNRRVVLDPRGAPRPWRLRTRRAGDRFWPLGARGPVDLRRFMQSRHVIRFDRCRLPLLVDREDRVLWIPGVEIADPNRVQLDTADCFVIKLAIVGGEHRDPRPY